MEKNSPQGVPAGKGGFPLWGWGLSEGQERSESPLSLGQLGVCQGGWLSPLCAPLLHGTLMPAFILMLSFAGCFDCDLKLTL